MGRLFDIMPLSRSLLLSLPGTQWHWVWGSVSVVSFSSFRFHFAFFMTEKASENTKRRMKKKMCAFPRRREKWKNAFKGYLLFQKGNVKQNIGLLPVYRFHYSSLIHVVGGARKFQRAGELRRTKKPKNEIFAKINTNKQDGFDFTE